MEPWEPPQHLMGGLEEGNRFFPGYRFVNSSRLRLPAMYNISCYDTLPKPSPLVLA